MGLKCYSVSARDIDKVLLVESDFGFKSNGKEKASNFFLINGVPEEYQKIFLIGLPQKKGITRFFNIAITKQNFYELISGFQFCMVSRNGSDNGSIRLINVPFNEKLSKSGFYDVISLDLNDKPIALDEVKEFFLNLRSKNLILGYFSALHQLFSESKEAIKSLDNDRGGYLLEDIDKALKKSIKKNR